MFLAVAFVISVLFILKDAKKEGLDPGSMLDCVVIILLSGVLGGRLLFVAINWKEYLSFPGRILLLHEGGLAFQGALAGAVVGGLFAARAKHIPFWKGADVFAPYIALGQAIGRIGCFFNGCCYGIPSDSGIRVLFPGHGTERIPAQLYSSALLFGLFALLVYAGKKRRFRGFLFSLYLRSYGALRFFMDLMRDDNPGVLGMMKLSQILSLVILSAGAGCYYFLKKGASENIDGKDRVHS